MLPNWPIVYVPKALTVVSHYPFYGAFTGTCSTVQQSCLSVCPSVSNLHPFARHFMYDMPCFSPFDAS